MKIQIFDEHIEAFIFWDEKRKKKYINRDDTLLHVDSHDDMQHPYKLDKSLFFIEDPINFAERNLHIANFIIPAAIRGCFSEILFLSSYNKPAKKSGNLTDISKKNLQKQKLRYYSWKDEGKIWYKNLKKNEQELIYCRKKYSINYKPIFSYLQLPKNKEIILDIDMDYFSSNSQIDFQFKPLLTKSQIHQAKMFSISDDIYHINLGLVTIDKDGRFIEASAYQNSKKENKIYNDDPIWIEFAIREFVYNIKKIKTKLISISRSVKTGHTPKKYQNLIESKLLECLTANTFIDITPPYNATFLTNPEIYYAHDTNHIINKSNLKEYYFQLKTDIMLWKMISEKAKFGDMIECLKKEYGYSKKKAENYLIKYVWFLKKERILK